MSPNTLGALLMTLSMACFVLNDTFLKLLAGAVPMYQLIFLRGLVTTGLITALGKRMGTLHFRIARRDWGIIAVRALSEVVIAYFFLNALFNMPLANVTAIMQVAPLAITLASAVVLREAVGWRRMLAVSVGFAGVMLIVQPGADGFTSWSLYGLGAVAGVTLRDLITRRLDPSVPSMTVTLVTALAVMAAAGLMSITEVWVALDVRAVLLLSGSAVFIIGGYFFSIKVMRVGDVSFSAPFRYTGLVWALLLGWFIFGDWPGGVTLLGAAVVVATGIYTFWREQRLAHRD